MKLFIPAFFALLTLSVSAQRLPTGAHQPNRERAYDLIHYKADLTIDLAKKGVTGEASVRLRPLYRASEFTLDAYWLRVSGVREEPSGTSLRFTSTDSTLTIDLGRTVKPSDTITVSIRYTATPTAGMYFPGASPGTNGKPAIFTYGEGGIHANWLPIYNDVNDKFSSEMIVTVPKPHTAISNGRLVSTRENQDGTRSFHWSQALPHSNYLIALFVGEYTAVPLRSAFDTIPLTAWVHPGREDQARFVFQRTPDMVEFFSDMFRFPYPWEKYDQVSAYDYAIGAMENTSITGHNDRILRKPGQSEEFPPHFDHYNSNWTTESIIAHELAHHWFGNNTTCRSLANIWMNESFASYLMMLWDEHRLGKEYLQSQTDFALESYLKYVAKSHLIRPLEYRYFDTREQIYNTETTYQKGAVVLHMMRWVLGDDDFFAVLSSFQDKYRLSNVESMDLLKCVEETTGRDFDWFFEQWIWGGGHPIFEARASYLAGQQKVEVVLEQVQPFVEGQGLFTLPVAIRIDVKGTTKRHVVWVRNQTEYFLFDAPGPPDLVSVDGRGWLVADIRFKKPLADLVYQIANDDLAGRLRALREMCETYASDPAVTAALHSILESDAHWSLRSEAALQLRSVHTQEAEDVLVRQLSSQEYHIRKASAIALGSRYTESSRKALRAVIENDPVDDVAATALVSLARIDASLSLDFFQSQCRKPSWYHSRELASLTAIQILASDHRVPTIARLVPFAREYAGLKHNYALRLQALKTWAACSPTDPELHDRLILAASTDILSVRTTALELLGSLRIERALPALREVALRNGDSDIRKAAQSSIDEIRRIHDLR